MKKLITLFLSVLVSFEVATAGVSVIIDGESYSCTKGGSSSSECKCKLGRANYPTYQIIVDGEVIAEREMQYYHTKADALAACKEAIATMPACK